MSSFPPIHFGLETEYGITRDGVSPENLDVVDESIALVRATTEEGVWMRWDYRCEDPHVDARGFRVGELRQDSDEANYFARDARRKMTFTEIKSDIALVNGARFYNDHAHPEYCTPECSTLLEFLVQDRFSDQLLMACAREVSERGNSRGLVRVYKNNTDFRGHSYGCHENYLLPREVPWQNLSRAMVAFFVTRQIIAGTGKYGQEDEDRALGPGFQISQRGDFFRVVESVDTMQRRPIVNTRDEPHADPELYRRFHVICGDANMSPYAAFLKVGTTIAVLDAISAGVDVGEFPLLGDPVAAIREISRDRSWKWTCRLRDGATVGAIEIQRRYLDLARRYARSSLPDRDRVFQAWEEVLDDLEKDPLSTADRLDWTAKFRLLDQFRQGEGLDEDDPWLQSLDLSYHLLDEDEGLYNGLRDQNALRLPYAELASLKTTALCCAPPTTRAAVRGACIQKFGDQVDAAQWDHVHLRDQRGVLEINLRGVFDETLVRRIVAQVALAESVGDLESLPIAKRLHHA